MSKGILVFGATGVGDTTLGKAVAEGLGYPHFDIDDYTWRWDTEVPYTALRPREERIDLMMGDFQKHPYFVMSGFMWSIRKAFEPMITLAVFMTAPTAVRVERLRARELSKHGKRVLPGGDMQEQYGRLLVDAEAYDTGESPQACLKQHEEWAAELPCPVLRVDGTKKISENTAWIIQEYQGLADQS